jgi:hypothetical protein
VKILLTKKQRANIVKSSVLRNVIRLQSDTALPTEGYGYSGEANQEKMPMQAQILPRSKFLFLKLDTLRRLHYALPMKDCRQCIFATVSCGELSCRKKPNLRNDGIVVYDACYNVRSHLNVDDACGPDGLWFEPIPESIEHRKNEWLGSISMEL